MNLNLENKSIGEQIKIITLFRGLTMKHLAEELNKRFGTKHFQQTISKKIKTNVFSYNDLKQIGEILGFEVELKMID